MCFSRHTFLRHFGEMSLSQNQRNGAKYLLRDAEPFLRFIAREPRKEKEIIRDIASFYGCPPEEVAEDFRAFAESISGALLRGENEAELSAQEPEFRYFSAEEVKNLEKGTSFAGDGAAEPEPEENIADELSAYFQDHPSPQELHIDLTSACTERCVHCYIPDYKNRFLPFETVCRILEEYRGMNGLRVTFSGGEPMLHPQFREILRHARKCDLMIYILSNLTLLDEETAKILAEVDIHYLQTSVYSMIPAVHESITRRPGSFAETMLGIGLMRKYNIPLKINTPVMMENFESWRSVKDFCADQNYKFLSNASLTGRTNHDNSNLDHALTADRMECYLRNCQDCDPWNKSVRKDAEEPICNILEQKINVDSQGNYYPCDGCHGLILGNCNEMSLEQVWNGVKANMLRGVKQKDYLECLNCADREFCKICPTNNFNETGDIFKHIPQRCALAKIKRAVYETR